MIAELKNLPPQQLPFGQKNKAWRKKHLDWADNRTFFNDNAIRRSVLHKKLNYNLLIGKIRMDDMMVILNPDAVNQNFIPETIQHYPIINSKLNVLRGEESKRRFDFRLVVTNPNAISEIEKNKKEEIFERLKELVADTAQSEEDFNKELENINNYYTYEWQDIREIRGNTLLNHYIKELNLPIKFNSGFLDAMTVGEEIYQVDIVSGEPIVERINPLKIRVFKTGYSNRVEDADIVVLEDFWSPGRIIDTYYDVLSAADMKYIEELPRYFDSQSNDYDETKNFVNIGEADGVIIDSYALFAGPNGLTNNYTDNAGNIKVLRVYWKSRRKIKKVKSYNPQTGEEEYHFYPETYIINKDMGEEEETFWVNEAWEGTKIGKSIYVNMRPRPVQYNRLSNPSKCHFGIIGSMYNLNDDKPFSLVDMMKPYSYLYDAIHDRLNKAIAANWGRILELDLAAVPKGWDIEKWLYYAKINKIAVKDSFKEGNIGAATGKLSGMMNNASRGVIDAETGNHIQHHINLLEFIKMEMAEVAGISKQREGQVSNRETVGGVERATLQSSHITEWLFLTHDDVKRRVLEALLETAKVALKGRTKKFQYILSDMSMKVMDIDGDEFSEVDYGLMINNSPQTQLLESKLETLAQAALQNQTLSFGTIMKIYTNTSLAETQRIIEKEETKRMQAQQEQAQQANETQKQIAEMQEQGKQAERELKDSMNQRDNETKLLIAQMGQFADEETSEDVEYSQEAKDKLAEQIRQFDESLYFEKQKHSDTMNLKEKELTIKKQQPTKTK